MLAQGANYVKKQTQLNVTSSNLQHTLRTLKQRWDAVLARAADKKIKLEIALKEATEFHEALQIFVEWLTNAEKQLANASPISRVLPTVQQQIEDHKSFNKDISNYRESMLQLDKKGTHLKYFSQKQDVILIKNLLVSVQHRWERVVAKCTERTRSLDHGYKESREFYDAWTSMVSWLKQSDQQLDQITDELNGSTDAAKIKQVLDKVQNIHRGLSSKQSEYDVLLRSGKSLIDRAPKTDEPELQKMINELKELWTKLCSKSIDRQRKLEESLLVSGQFSDALKALLDWLRKAHATLSEPVPVYGDIDTVSGLVEKHRRFETDLDKRSKQLESVLQTGKQVEKSESSSPEIISNLHDVQSLWDEIQRLNSDKNENLKDSMREAEKLHKSVNILMEWLSEAEQKLKYAPAIPADEGEANIMLQEFMVFLQDLREKEFDKNETLSLAQNILNQAHPDAIPIIRTIIASIVS